MTIINGKETKTAIAQAGSVISLGDDSADVYYGKKSGVDFTGYEKTLKLDLSENFYGINRVTVGGGLNTLISSSANETLTSNSDGITEYIFNKGGGRENFFLNLKGVVYMNAIETILTRSYKCKGLLNLPKMPSRKSKFTEQTYSSLKSSIMQSKKGGYVFYYHAPVLIIVANQKNYGNNIADCAVAVEIFVSRRVLKISVKAMKVLRQTTKVTYGFPGQVQGTDEIQIRSKINGAVVEKYIQGGDRVHAGQALFKIDSRPYETALLSAQADLNKAESNFRRTQDTLVEMSDFILCKRFPNKL